MAAGSQRPKLLTIVGPTASGKSELALRIAKAFNGELICADSRTVYKGMDIGTAKPTKTDQKAVPHWGLDLVEVGQRYSAFQFKQYALGKIADIQARSKLPILVGGTGLYIDSILFDFKFGPDTDQQRRSKLEKLSIEQLQAKILKLGYPMPENLNNKRYLVRAIEQAGSSLVRNEKLSSDVLVVGILPTDEELRQRIDKRAEAIFSEDLVAEVDGLTKTYGRTKLLKTAGIVYKICMRFMAGDITKAEALELFKIGDWQYARRQKTWFKRNPNIVWFDSVHSAFKHLSNKFE